MTKRFRKILSILCALALLVTCMAAAFATDEQPAEIPDEEATDVVTGEESGEDALVYEVSADGEATGDAEAFTTEE